MIELIIAPNPGLRLRSALGELWTYRHVVVAFAERDVRLKYKQAAFGVAWAVIQPLMLMGVFAVTVGRLSGISGAGTPYPASVLAALVPWIFLQNAVAFGGNALVANAAMVRKVYFPREVPVLGSVLGTGLDFAVGVVLLVIAEPLLGARISPAWLCLPILWGILAILASGAACLFAGLTAYYRDFRYALPFGLQLWLLASPVAYSLSLVPVRWAHMYVVLNPAAGVLEGFREVLVLGRVPAPGLLAVSLAGSLVVALTGYRVLKWLEPNLADRV
jgi:ABC-type polysaccharide/polyol phosphate export permease